MKTLYLVRHAKAIPCEAEINDFKRLLSKDGQEDAQMVAKRLSKKRILPDLLLASPADRALETAHIFAEKLHYPHQRILLQEELYAAEQAERVCTMLQALPDQYETVMLFGHEPLLSACAGLLVPDFSAELLMAGVIGIYLDISEWRQLSEGQGTLSFFDFPVRAIPKVDKEARKVIKKHLSATMEDLLEQIDVEISKHVRKVIKKTSKKFAKELLNVLQTPKVRELASGKGQPRIDRRPQTPGEKEEEEAGGQNH